MLLAFSGLSKFNIVFPWGVKRLEREADHSPSSSAQVKEWVELYLHFPSMPSWGGAHLKHRDKFTFTLPNLEITILWNILFGKL